MFVKDQSESSVPIHRLPARGIPLLKSFGSKQQESLVLAFNQVGLFFFYKSVLITVRTYAQ
jgi:hypothetical protein